MTILKTTYAGLKLNGPFIVSSSGLTRDIRGVERANQNGADAVVLKSLFEEQILYESYPEHVEHTEANDYLSEYNSSKYLRFIEESKKKSDIPVIASLQCTSPSSWASYAKEIELSGADALELNIIMHEKKEYEPHSKFEKWFYDHYPYKPYLNPSKVRTSVNIENDTVKIIEKVRKSIKIPLVVKLTPQVTSLINFSQRLDKVGVNGLVLFNTLFTPDFDINTKKIIRQVVLTHPEQVYHTLRWTALLHDEVKCDLSASTGVHNAESAIKLLLAGASSLQLCSLLYNEGFKAIGRVKNEMEEWLDKNNYKSISAIKGKLNSFLDTNIYNRLQYVKNYNNFD